MNKPNKPKNAHKIVPMGDRVLLRPEKESEVRRVGAIKIVLPESKEKSDRGEVVAVGEGRYQDGKLLPMSVRVGDTVIFSKYGYDEITVGGEELYLIKEDSILAILK